jgi:hypothetical protein
MLRFSARPRLRIKLALVALVLALGAAARPAQAALPAAINRAALATRAPDSLYVRDGKVMLYGQQTNGADTRKGKWACAKVVSIVLRKAGVPIAVELGVAGVERSLKGWRRIADKAQLRPGDVVVWTNRFKGNDDGSCTGKGTCHVGIYTSDGYFHNDPLGDKPVFGGIGLLGFSFKVAFRPPG